MGEIFCVNACLSPSRPIFFHRAAPSTPSLSLSGDTDPELVYVFPYVSRQAGFPSSGQHEMFRGNTAKFTGCVHMIRHVASVACSLHMPVV